MDRRFAMALAAIEIIALLAATSVDARMRWPWESPRYHSHSRQRGAVGRQVEESKPNCEQINSAIKTLSPTNYEQAMRSSTKKQREYITACQGVKNP